MAIDKCGLVNGKSYKTVFVIIKNKNNAGNLNDESGLPAFAFSVDMLCSSVLLFAELIYEYLI